MIKKALYSVVFFIFFFFVFSSFYLIGYSQNIVFKQEKAVYELPYPGMLPDNPLYFAKAIRDRIMDIAMRDYIKKAELYLSLADKRVAMSLLLAKKGKTKLALTTFTKGEKYFYKIPFLLKESKRQGVSPASELVEKLKQSNHKHREIAEQFLKELPQGHAEELKYIISLVSQIEEELKKF